MPGTIEDPFYPPVEPFLTDLLDVGDGHQIYYEQCGNPDGLPVLFLHGGPGAGCSAKQRQLFDPSVYMICLHDQRGCGRSKPNAADDLYASLKDNTTQHLVADCERLRQACNVEGAWHIVVGGSWGSTLGVAYAVEHPTAVKALVLRGVFTGEQSDIDYLFNDGGMMGFHPEQWEAFAGHIQETAPTPEAAAEDARCILAAYYRRLTSEDEKVAGAAAVAWGKYELSIIKNEIPHDWIKALCADPKGLIPFTVFECHYMLNHCFLRNGELLDKCANLPKDLKVRICHGRCDFCTRPIAAHRLAKSMRAHGLTDIIVNFVPGSGHHDSEAATGAAMVVATDELRSA